MIKLNVKKYRWLIYLFFLTILGISLRIYKLGELPASMHRDELAIAYNAYSILKTGKDEWGVSTPLSFKSFGDYKLPAMVYATIPGIKLFGLTPFGARLPAALYSSLAIPITFLFVEELFKSKKMALIASLILTVSFWHLSNSRNIYEPVIIISLSILSYWALFKAKKNIKYLYLSLFFFLTSIWVYNTAILIFPPLFVIWLAYNWKQLANSAKTIWLMALITLLALTLTSILLTSGITQGKSQTTLLFSSELIDQQQERLHRFWSSGIPLFPVFTKWERVFQIGHYFYKSYIASIDPNYFFFTGGNNDWHNLRSIGFGDMNPALLPFAMFGLIYMAKKYKKPEYFFVLALFVTSPIPSAITVDAPNTNRLIDLHFVLMVLATFGFYQVVLTAKSKISRLALACSVIIFFVFTGQFLFRYFVIYNKLLSEQWQPNLPELVRKVASEQENYDQVFVEPTIPAVYIYYAFYTQFRPELLQSVSRVKSATFNPVDQLGHVTFGEYQSQNTKQKTLIVESVKDELHDQDLVFTINNWEGKPIWQGYEK
ncbi:MAG: glycosyltransferase family 39 protein [Patescibacteria group bacterium]